MNSTFYRRGRWTALPDPVEWESPRPGGWTRNFRLGEWLPEPVTPLSATWLLPGLEEGFAVAQRASLGIEPPRPLHVLVNGWYFYSPFGTGSPWQALGVLRRPKYLGGLLLMNRWPQVIHRLVIQPETVKWRESLLVRYRELVEHGLRVVETADGPGPLHDSRPGCRPCR